MRAKQSSFVKPQHAPKVAESHRRESVAAPTATVPLALIRAHQLQRLVGNAVATRLLGAQQGDQRLKQGDVRRTTSVIQRHTQGVLDKINSDLEARRPGLRGHDPTAPSGGDLLEYIYTHVGEIAKLPGMVTVCKGKDELKAALATDLAARAGASTVTDDHRTSAANDVDNGGGGFTALDGTVFMLESTNDSSALYHELIHVLSAPGGTTQLSKTKVNLNEGFTNYFAEELSTKYKKATFPAYPAATAWVRKFVAKYGRETAYNVYFKDDEALLYSTMAATLKSNAVGDKAIHDANAKDKAKNPTRFTSNVIKTLFTGASVKDDAALAELIRKKIIASDFLSLDEPNLKWLDTGILS